MSAVEGKQGVRRKNRKGEELKNEIQQSMLHRYMNIPQCIPTICIVIKQPFLKIT